jgi:hypothetical protein
MLLLSVTKCRTHSFTDEDVDDPSGSRFSDGDHRRYHAVRQDGGQWIDRLSRDSMRSISMRNMLSFVELG